LISQNFTCIRIDDADCGTGSCPPLNIEFFIIAVVFHFGDDWQIAVNAGRGRWSHRTIILATVTGYIVTVIALLTCLYCSITTGRGRWRCFRTITLATVAIRIVAVVAGFAGIKVAVTADRGRCFRTITLATVAIRIVAVIAGFAGIKVAVTADRGNRSYRAITLAAIAIY
jgi:hypothetical protein